MTRFSIVILAVCSLALPASAQRSPPAYPKPLPGDVTPQVQRSQCGNYTGQFGPFDYRKADPAELRSVEANHLDMEMQTFLSGRVYGRNRAGTSNIIGGFQYALRAFPNHPLALYAIEQLGRKLKSERPQDSDLPLECWYVRAFEIAPDDPVVRALYGLYLAYRQRREEALYQLELGSEGTRYRASIQNQIGLAYLQLGETEKAQIHAMRATRLGYGFDGLERSLRQAKKWNDTLRLPESEESPPTPAPAAPAASAP